MPSRLVHLVLFMRVLLKNSDVFGMISSARSPAIMRKVSEVWRIYSRRYIAQPYASADEVVTVHPAFSNLAAMEALKIKRPRLNIFKSEALRDKTTALWSLHRGRLQIDSLELEDEFIGSKEYTSAETADIWNGKLLRRYSLLEKTHGDLKYPQITEQEEPVFGDGGRYQKELDAAVVIVQRASYMARSLQKLLVNVMSPGSGASLSKNDHSPVTIADYAVQALVIDFLREQYPEDKFIAEETSELVRLDEEICDGVLEALFAATGDKWSKDKLCTMLDSGGFLTTETEDAWDHNADGDINEESNHDSSGGNNEMISNRVWVLDPIDGTKGFMRGEHFCIALGLLVEGKPVVSAMGCPNLNLRRVLQGSSYDNNPISHVDQPHTLLAADALSSIRDENLSSNSSTSANVPAGSRNTAREFVVHNSSSGSIYFAASGRGAFARSLSMPYGAAFEVSVSGTQRSVAPGKCLACGESEVEIGAWGDATLCEAAEASHGDRTVTGRVFDLLSLKSDYVRLDGQCKYCIVGSGAAEGNIRLPAKGYREKIWDHVPGSHFIEEAGGKMTDLQNRKLDFSLGRFLPSEVNGIVASNGFIHNDILSAIAVATTADQPEQAQ